MQYRVTQVDTVTYRYEVEAPDRQSARELVLSGEVEPISKDDNVDFVDVEEIDWKYNRRYIVI